MIRLAASLRSGDLTEAAAAASQAEALASRIPGDTLARHPDIRARVLSGRGAVELWSGHLDEAAGVLESGVAAATACGGENEPADCLGHLALTEALRGRLRRAATVAGQATAARTAGQQRPPVPHPSPAALVALAWVHLEHYELREAHSRLTQADAALGADPDQLIAAAGLAGRCLRRPGRRTRRGRRAERGQGTVRVGRPGLARPPAEPGPVAGARDRRRHPGSTRRSRTGRQRHLAGGHGHPRPRVGDRRRHPERTAGARPRARGPQRGARPGTPAGPAR